MRNHGGLQNFRKGGDSALVGMSKTEREMRDPHGVMGDFEPDVAVLIGPSELEEADDFPKRRPQ